MRNLLNVFCSILRPLSRHLSMRPIVASGIFVNFRQLLAAGDELSGLEFLDLVVEDEFMFLVGGH